MKAKETGTGGTGGTGTGSNVPWKKQVLYAKDGDVLIASIGPTGGDKGYKAITGRYFMCNVKSV